MSINHDKAVAIVFDELGPEQVDIFITFGKDSSEWLKTTARQIVDIINNQVLRNNFKDLEKAKIQ
jgi:hypothetical protein